MQRLDILHPSIDDYLLDITPERDEVLTEMEAHARTNRFPIVGPLVGRVLHQLVLLTNPTRIFEMGSGFGYSAYWMAKALQKTGSIHHLYRWFARERRSRSGLSCSRGYRRSH